SEANRNRRSELDRLEQEYLKFRQEAPLNWKHGPGVPGAPNEASNVHQERATAIEAERSRILVKRAETNSRIQALEAAIARGDSPRRQQSITWRDGPAVRQYLCHVEPACCAIRGQS